jgi:phage terminase large subunit
LRVQFPEKLGFPSEPHRYKVLCGGRGGIKSWSIAQHLLIEGAKRPLRIPCAQETMQSIRESVHELMEDQIARLGLQADYEVQKAEIMGRNGAVFTFHGLRDQSVHNIKSLEGADILWVEEAQNVSEKSWRTVIPTIRKPGSEIWISFNPELDTDDTYKRFVISPPPNAVVVKTSWRDSPACLMSCESRSST